MPLTTLIAIILLGISFLSLWIKRDPKIWGTTAAASVALGIIGGNITWVGLIFVIILSKLWFFYKYNPNIVSFIILICLSISFGLEFLPGYDPYFITPKFVIRIEVPLIGLFPLALLVPLAKTRRDWSFAIKEGLYFGLGGIALLAMLAIISQTAHWDFDFPSHMGIRTLSNLILTSIPEEGFYRGFIQRSICHYYKNTKLGNLIGLIIASLLFSISHLYWSPSIEILIFTFLAALLYGSVYLYSKKIESAILTHFLFNFIHMTFFSYEHE
ncbi:exosortase E/protease, VPEID-CTERM system [Candidatus Rubidus massiliensis]|nr:MAG: hypothetical protein BGO10_09635 [Chlamydia sp. 32-24]CDZ81614.1 exosortase E/protease, VPEID-CTERM system [Candidatus Rubidus massiliensis]